TTGSRGRRRASALGLQTVCSLPGTAPAEIFWFTDGKILQPSASRGFSSGGNDRFETPWLARQTRRDFGEHGRKFSGARTVHAVDPPGRDFEQEGAFVEVRTFQNAVRRYLVDAVFAQRLAISADEACR